MQVDNVGTKLFKDMKILLDYPRIVLVVSFLLFWIAALLGAYIRKRSPQLDPDSREDFGVVQAAILTLLGLLIGFTFSMAVNRYDQRKNYEEAEANAIGTEFLRVELLPSSAADKLQELLRAYLKQRMLFYTTRVVEQRRQIDARTSSLQNDLWFAVRSQAVAAPSPTIALVVSGMNDVLNSQGYTQAAWWYRIPPQAWSLMSLIAFACNLLIGYGTRRNHSVLLLIVPLAVSISFFLIADIDSPNGGLIRVVPQNLMSLDASWTPH
jgi:hypothetical protein